MKKEWLLFLFILFQIAPYNAFGKKMPVNTGGRIAMIIQPVFGGQPLKLSDQYYVNEHGDTLFIDLFRFYMTHVNLEYAQFSGPSARIGHRPLRQSFLFDTEDTTENYFSTADVPPGTYGAITFTVGVDSADNTSGANDGDLDPAKGMYWAWNSGYIMAKLEGRSAVCKTLHHAFEFHIGGYMPPCNTARAVRLDLPQNIVVKSGGNTTIKIKADAAAWFRGNLDLSRMNSVVIPGSEASLTADRYAQMFSITDITQK